MTETIKGSVEKFFVRQPTGWGVALLRTSVSVDPSGWLRVAGIWPEDVEEQDFVEVVGEHETHQKYGKQLKLRAVVGQLGSTEEAVAEWLSHRLKHVGPERAKQLALLGPDLWHALESDPAKLREIKGLSDGRIEELRASYRAHWTERDTVIKLVEVGYTSKVAGLLFALYRARAFDELEADPYLPFTDLHAPFEDVDKVAVTHWKIAKDDPRRVGVVAVLLLRRALGDGECYLLEHTLTHGLSTELGLKQDRAKAALAKTNAVVTRGKYIFLREIDEAEAICAAKVRALVGTAT